MASAVEFALPVLGLALVFASPRVASRVRAMARRHRATSITIVALMVIGHSLGRSRDKFPFLRWDMYGEPAAEASSDIDTYRLHGVTKNGGNVPIRLSAVFGRAGWRVQSSLRRVAARVLRNDTDGAAVAALDAWLTATAARHERLHPDSPLLAIECRVARTRATDGRGAGPWVEHLVRRVELGGGR